MQPRANNLQSSERAQREGYLGWGKENFKFTQKTSRSPGPWAPAKVRTERPNTGRKQTDAQNFFWSFSQRFTGFWIVRMPWYSNPSDTWASSPFPLTGRVPPTHLTFSTHRYSCTTQWCVRCSTIQVKLLIWPRTPPTGIQPDQPLPIPGPGKMWHGHENNGLYIYTNSRHYTEVRPIWILPRHHTIVPLLSRWARFGHLKNPTDPDQTRLGRDTMPLLPKIALICVHI